MGGALLHPGATIRLTDLRNRSAGLLAAVMLWDVRHGLNTTVKMHILGHSPN
jgi:hypothetical protein